MLKKLRAVMLDSSPAACTAKASIMDIQWIKLVDAACRADVQTPPCKTERLEIVSVASLNRLRNRNPKRRFNDAKQPLKAFERFTSMYRFSPHKLF